MSMKMDMILFMDYMAFPIGLFLLYTGISMKRTGEIKSKILMSKGTNIEKAKDLQGYIDHAYYWNIFLGVVMLLYGIYMVYLRKIEGLQGGRISSPSLCATLFRSLHFFHHESAKKICGREVKLAR